MSTITTDASALNVQYNEYVAFDATSIRDFIRTRLTQSGLFTDQYLEGSNLTAITNIVAYSFHTLMFYLNKTSTESMFSEAQIYENINRIVKLINYSPIGAQSSTVTFTCSSTQDLNVGAYTLPRYSFIRVNNTPYSFNTDIAFTKSLSGNEFVEAIGNQALLYQGKWTEYPLYGALGVNGETVFVSPGSGVLVDHFNIDVYVNDINTGKWTQWTRTDSLYLENATSPKFEVRYNENRNYELKFGDNINGKKLNSGDTVAVYYLQSAGTEGQIESNALANLPAVVYSTAQFNIIKADVFDTDQVYLNDTTINALYFDNANPSTLYTEAENANSIRLNAPGAFKSQYRLITAQDFENFVKSTFNNIVQDVKTYSNTDYVNNHLRYLYDIGLTDPNQDSRVLYNQTAFSTSCNFNNIYVYAVPRATKLTANNYVNYLTPTQKALITNTVENKKVLTSDIIVMDPVYKAITVGYGENTDKDLNAIISESRLIVELERNSKSSTYLIQNKVKGVIQEFFNPTKSVLGYNIDLLSLTSQIESINGVRAVYTQRQDTGDRVQGIALVIWNPSYPSNDIYITTKNYKLKDFQTLYFNDIDELVNRILVTTDVSQDTSVVNI